MERALQRLERVLELEKSQGYQNKAVVGGIRQFAVYWITQAREEARNEADLALAEQIADTLMEYGRLPGVEARSRAIDSLLAGVTRRKERVGQQPLPETPATTPQVRKSPPPPLPAEEEEEVEAPAAAPVAPESPDEGDEEDEPEDEEEAVADEESEADMGLVEAEEDVSEAPEVEPDPVGLARSVRNLKGVGPKIAEKLNKLGAETISDLLYLFPRRYDDYTLLKPINKLRYGEQVTVIGTIWQTTGRRTRTNQTLVESIVSDGTGTIQATWFNQPWLVEQLPAGTQVVLSGKVDQFLGRLVFQSPEWELLELEPLRTRRIVPVYPLTEGLNGNRLREIMQQTVREWAPRVPDPLPGNIRRRRNLFNLPKAIQQMHFPENSAGLQRARRRLTFDELFLLQLGLQRQRREWLEHPAIPIPTDETFHQAFLERLPFALTGAQERVIAEILADLAGERPMNRLLQGDVGSGKTAVAAAAMAATARAGAQAALMAPTEILAEQHFRSLEQLLSPMGITVRLLTGGTPATERPTLYEGLSDGAIQVVIGTHALIQPSVTFKKLALVVIDEQHRFGVDQRAALRAKGPETAQGQASPHLLVMSATPIPRTLALSFFGDLDLSTLDEMPPGRQEIKTRWLRSSERERAYNFVRKQVQEGRQAYIIYPLVEESDGDSAVSRDARAAVAEHARLQQEVFPKLRVGLIHGRMKSEEKDAAMQAFHRGETDVLVATSVIEVGVDVPNSTVIVIEGANRFGLAQLHQFRGRVGRGEHPSYCVLIADDVSSGAEERLAALEATNDGFVLAEKDLELRGPGEFFGRQQSGLPELRLASLLHDREVLEIAQQEALALAEIDPFLELPEHSLLRERVVQFWTSTGDVS